jgi:hypothetical protein
VGFDTADLLLITFSAFFRYWRQINEEKTKYMVLSHHQNAGQNWDIKIANRLFENIWEQQ